jgi:8-oxo-dGTP pyrophosphatase MutT (NUDIX family)
MKSRWKYLGTEQRYNDCVLSVEHREYHFDGAGKSMPFTVVNLRDWVAVVPVTTGGDIVLVRQYRIGTDEITYEFPGGAVDTGEDFNLAAPRELEEETGYIAEKIGLMASIRPNPAFMTNSCHCFLAENCAPTGKMNPDLFEDAEPVIFSFDKVKHMALKGEITHSISLAALSLFLLK